MQAKIQIVEKKYRWTNRQAKKQKDREANRLSIKQSDRTRIVEEVLKG